MSNQTLVHPESGVRVTPVKTELEQKHTAVRIRMWSPTILLTDRRVA